ncbi:HD domain-containing protein [Virgibacillus dakarensis]|uniref:Phosphohydrolase n=1 Tax=Lentibacillus populi TaxID=1827502 RepID=A0A9W5TVI6_9BACI|nr:MULTISPECIES: HD domain-containing protein [Bacillaceae]MBT2214216.1 HD domain-containing protein [Virgibacillus dakarensis]MTW85959.1 HD domain-containing protein [Virgibacillus dakarensis]GGB33076.1 phosphohydrolase [Lentibacillus populi]
MEKGEQLLKIQNYCLPLFQDDATGHDFFHMKRVARMARLIAKEENADTFICEAAAWLHDVGDHKLFADPEKALKETDLFLQSIDITDEWLKQIKTAMKDVSFSKGQIPETIEGKIVQDADRLDAIGAIGIARTFAYGGVRGQLIYHDTNRDKTSIQHFYDKLLKLKAGMHTKTAKRIAAERHLFMEEYLARFFKEW